MADIDYDEVSRRVALILQSDGYALENLQAAASIAGLWLSPVLKMENGIPVAYRVDINLLKGNPGDNGKPVEFQKNSTHVQWRIQGSATWTNLVALSEIQGDVGKNIELTVSATHIQWRKMGDTSWNNLVALDTLKVKGDPGKDFKYTDFTPAQLEALKVKGDPGKDFKYTDFTPEQLEALKVKGDPGKDFKYTDFTPAQLEALKVKGDPGKDFKYSDFTPLQIEAIRGPRGYQSLVLPNGNYGNWDSDINDWVDSGVKALVTVDLQSIPVAFENATSRTNLITGDLVPVAFGKIWKWFSDLKALAFKDSVNYDSNEVTNKPTLGSLAEKSKVDYNNDIDNRPTLGSLAAKNKIDYQTEINNLPTFKAVATTGSYNDLANKPTIPVKVSDISNDSKFQTEDQVKAAIAAIVNGAPGALDTLDELAAALGDNPHFATTIMEMLGDKVEKVTGKSLVFDTEIAKLATLSRSKQKTISLTVTGWVKVGEKWTYNIYDSDILSDSFVQVVAIRADRKIAQEAEINEEMDVITGRCTVYAEKQPATIINCKLTIQ